MADPFIGEIKIFAGTFAPRNWALCNGQLLQISQYTALFSLLGTTYGGDGRTTFGLPDLRGRAPMHWGHGPGLSSRQWGERGGVENVTLSEAQLPAHNHVMRASGERGDDGVAVGNYLGAGTDLFALASDGSTMAAASLPEAGGGGSHNNRQPFLTLNFIIALVGIYPSWS